MAGNTRDGRLFHLGGNRWLGERRGRGGRFDERRFEGDGKTVTTLWHAWRDEALRESTIVVGPARTRQDVAPALGRLERPHGAAGGERKMAERKAATDKVQDASSVPERMFVLQFQGQRSRKDVALFASDDAALQMAEALTVALEAVGMEGEYSVDELPVWGR